VITGIGVVSPIGLGKRAYWDALKAGTSGVGHITLFDASDYPVRIAAEVKDFDPLRWMDKKEARRADRVIQFAVAAAEMAVEDASLKVDSLDKERFGVYLASGEGGISTTWDNVNALIQKGPERVSPFFIPMMISNMPAAYVAMRYGAKGPNICVVTACASANHTMGEAFEAIKRGIADVILTGGAEAAITPIGIAGFASMKALSTRNEEPGKASRPFDAQRDGFVMGEGAAVFVFEELGHALSRGAKIYGEVLGYGMSCDAYHITAPDPDGYGAAMAMRLALKEAGLSPEAVQYVNAHGTSTPLNDRIETMAIKSVFGEHARRLYVNSTKSMIGHGLGAAGALELAAALMALEEGVIHPTINYEEPDPECDLNYVPNRPVEAQVEALISNSFGFGGHNAVLAVGRWRG